jgi:sortase A
MRLKNLILILAALTTVLVLTACNFLEQSTGDQETPDKQVAPEQAPQESGGGALAVEPPSKDMLKLTIPQMERIKDDEIPTGPGTDETLFHDYAAVHLENTGYPWQKEANVYIAGHRLGFPGTKSYLAFWDLNELKQGDEFYITDSEGRKYTYEVFRKFVASPENLSVLAPIDGKNVVTLQTCTLPDYSSRLLVRAELKDIEET